MLDQKQIPYLVKLLDDDSLDVRSEVASQLASFGPTLKRELNQLSFNLNSSQKDVLNGIFRKQKKILLKQKWPAWIRSSSSKREGKSPESGNSEYGNLQKALIILADFLSEADEEMTLDQLLGSLVVSYKNKYRKADPLLLAEFLFQHLNLKGNEKDYYNPQNSNLTYVIKKKKGIPISLSCVYMLVGAQLGLKIEGCHFPGHFLTRVEKDGEPLFIDCFSSGQVIEERDLLQLREGTIEGIEDILREKAEGHTIVRRFLANLIRAYELDEDEENSQLMIDLFKDLDRTIFDKKFNYLTPDDIILDINPIFEKGELVHHKRYGYRGIIVDIDYQCQAADSWYYTNQTQPEKNQAWYHVLVDGSDQVTYVAECNLLVDDSKDKINHPLITYFFTQSTDGSYVRNNNPWPDTEM